MRTKEEIQKEMERMAEKMMRPNPFGKPYFLGRFDALKWVLENKKES